MARTKYAACGAANHLDGAQLSFFFSDSLFFKCFSCVFSFFARSKLAARPHELQGRHPPPPPSPSSQFPLRPEYHLAGFLTLRSSSIAAGVSTMAAVRTPSEAGLFVSRNQGARSCAPIFRRAFRLVCSSKLADSRSRPFVRQGTSERPLSEEDVLSSLVAPFGTDQPAELPPPVLVELPPLPVDAAACEAAPSRVRTIESCEALCVCVNFALLARSAPTAHAGAQAGSLRGFFAPCHLNFFSV